MKKVLGLIALLATVSMTAEVALAKYSSLPLSPQYQREAITVQNAYKMKANALQATYKNAKQMHKEKIANTYVNIKEQSSSSTLNPAALKKSVALYHKQKQALYAVHAKYRTDKAALKKDRNAKMAVVETKWANSVKK